MSGTSLLLTYDLDHTPLDIHRQQYYSFSETVRPSLFVCLEAQSGFTLFWWQARQPKVTRHGMSHRGRRYWNPTFASFIREWIEIHPDERDEVLPSINGSALEQRICTPFLSYSLLESVYCRHILSAQGDRHQ